jgi:hypothetical protein
VFFGFPPSEISQYYWDEVWLWEAYGSIPDNSQYYPGAVYFAVHEGHGNLWETASVGDWSTQTSHLSASALAWQTGITKRRRRRYFRSSPIATEVVWSAK